MKKKGFTLIELLAVIVILAIIALIATPLVLKYIEKSRSESKVDSAYSFVRNLETEMANYALNNKGSHYNKVGQQDINDLDELNTTVKGENPDNGKVCISSVGQVEKGVFEYENGKYYVSYDGKKGSIIDETTYTNFSCSGSDIVITEKAGLYDIDGNLLYSWDELVNNYGIDLEKDYWDYEEEEAFVEESLWPGTILSSNEDLNNGVKLVIDNSVTEIGCASLFSNTTLNEIIIPNSVISIDNMAFYGCTSLEKIVIPNGVTSIGISAFSDCTGLTEVTIPNSVTSIGSDAFGNCTSLTKATILNSVISSHIFWGCTSLNEVTLGRTVTSITASAFGMCPIKIINYEGTESEWNDIQIGGSMPSDYMINYNYVIEE